MSRYKFTPFLFVFLSILIFLFGISQKLNVPLTEWDWVSLSAGENWSNGINSAWLFDHPPLYPAFLALVFRIFGVSVSVARLANVFCILVTALVIYKLAYQLSNRWAGLWAVVFYLLSPLSIQGITAIDLADSSLLPLGFIALFYFINRTYSSPGILNIALVGITVALCLWAKVTSTLGLLLGVLSYPLINHHGLSHAWAKAAIGSILGICMFLITWASISIPLWGMDSFSLLLVTPLSSFAVRLANGGLLPRLLSLGLDSLRIIFWFSPFFIYLYLWKTVLIWKMRKEKKLGALGLLTWSSLFYSLGYLVIGGTNWGFPRYHAAILPLLAILVGILVQPIIEKLTKKEGLILLGAMFSLWLTYLLLVNDPLLFFNLKWKGALLFGSEPFSLIEEGILQVVLLLGLPLLICPVFVTIFGNRGVKESILLTLCVASFATIFFVDFKQMYATYNTFYQYGAQEKEEVVKMVSRHVKAGELVLTTPEFVYEFRDKDAPQVLWKVWRSPGTIYKSIEEMKPKAIIAGLTTHTFEQLQWIFHNPTIQLELNQHYNMYKIGTYFVWIRKYI
ncbi:MAG: glycosyltransferase family 39 protein [Desulfobacteria bacterium]